MGKIALTGGDGFLGWHTQLALREVGAEGVDIGVGDFFDEAHARQAVDGAERLVHLAGVNRGSDEEVAEGNARFAEQIASVLRSVSNPPKTVAFSNSIQAQLGNVYGDAKLRAAEILQSVCDEVGAQFIDVRFPNLFGEHGRPFYNSVTATFCHLLATGGSPTVAEDRELTLLHAADAADVLVGILPVESMGSKSRVESVSGLLARLTSIADVYRGGEIPDITTDFDRDLFNTYRSYTVPGSIPIPLVRHADARGSFFEILRARGGSSQASFSTTEPGVTRGDHFHRRKVERFVVLAGEAHMRLRKVLTSEVLDLEALGQTPVAVDMPTGWTHNITNTGSEVLYTAFWTDDLYDPDRPDTVMEKVDL
ncbi:MAG: NAD-dependent epimerase/dehydratase family protein [Propionibacteriaceae bacterium]|jgi:UDP-2-acetamido-2,6-beta-L-arabino-hexul-4-ose reductase|nr:NAD-dependent epimerase/dehydratase family protein [Propionibacteriaceae bacterium]